MSYSVYSTIFYAILIVMNRTRGLSMKKRICILLWMLLLLSVYTISYSTKQESEAEILVVSEKQLPILQFENTPYVSLYALCLALGESSASVQADNEVCITVQKGALTASAKEGERYIVANGRYLYSDHPNVYQNKVLYVPFASALEAVGGSATQNENGHYLLQTNALAAIEPADHYYDADEVLWLSRIIHAESGNQPLAGKIAVGTVVMNRVDSPKYPNTIYGVIFDKKYGVQFTPTENGTVWCKPSEESVLAAKCVLDGYRTDPDILFFMNEEIAVSTWISDNCDYAFTIADHSFWS